MEIEGKELTSNVKIVEKFIRSVPKQVNFAMSNALNKTTDTALQAVEDEINSNFDTTTSWFKVGNKVGVRAKKSTKNNLESIMAIAKGGATNSFTGTIPSASKDHWIYDHEGGASRKANNSENILIPTNVLLGLIGSTKGREGRAKVKKYMDASNILFEKKIKGRNYLLSRSKKMVAGKRYGKTPTGRKSKKTVKVQSRANLLFLIKKRVKIKDEFDFFNPIMKVFERDLNNAFNKYFGQALRTMK